MAVTTGVLLVANRPSGPLAPGELHPLMARVSLILPRVAGDPSPVPRLADLRVALEEAGHEVELLVAADSSAEPLAGEEAGGFLLVTSSYAGLAAAAIAGLERSSGEMLIVLDLAM